jgi:hypothetical protein
MAATQRGAGEHSNAACSTMDDTVRDTLAWHAPRPAERQAQLRSGLAPEREIQLLAAWNARKPA